MFDILSNIQKLSKSISDDANHLVDLPVFCIQICDALNASVKVFSNHGKIRIQKSKLELIYPFYDITHNSTTLNEKYFDIFLSASESTFNITEPCSTQLGDLCEVCESKTNYFSVLLLKHFGEKLGGILISRCASPFIHEEIYFCHFAISILAFEAIGTLRNEGMTDRFLKNTAHLATQSLSYSELRAIDIALDSLGGNEGTIFLTLVAKQAYITVSLLSSALKKIESTGVLSSRFMGVKGKYIIIRNPYLKENIKAALSNVQSNNISSLND